MVRHWSVKDESNASWSICMYTYLRNVGPLFFMEFSFSQKFESLIVRFNGSFGSCLLESSLVILTLGRTWYHHTSLSSAPLSQELPILPNSFLERESWSQLYQMFFIAPLAWSYPQIFNSGLGMRLYEGRFGFWQGVVFMQNFWNFKAIPDTEIILTSIQSRLILKKFKWFLWRSFQMWWKLFILIFGEKYEVTSGWS